MKRIALLTLVLGTVFTVSSAFAYISPGKPAGYVNDYTGTLSTETEKNLEEILKKFQESGKGEIAVVIISTLNGDAIEDYSIALAREWGIGVKGKDNGVLFLVAKDDHELRIEVGYGFEGILTDAKSSRIIRDVVTPRFKEGSYDVGISEGVRSIIGVIDPAFDGGIALSNVSVESTSHALSSFNFTYVIPALYLVASVLSFVASILGRSKSWWLGGVLGVGVGGALSYVFTMGVIPIAVMALIGLFFDFVVSRGYQKSIENGTRPPWWTGGTGGFGGGSSGSSFGGFGGGSFGGGGSNGRW